MTRTATPALLTAPTLPQALRNGINALAAAQLLVDIAPYPGMDEGDLIELFWNNCFAASRRVTAVRSRHADPSCGFRKVLCRMAWRGFITKSCRSAARPARSAMAQAACEDQLPRRALPCARYSDENQNLAPVGLPETIRRYGVNASQVRRGIPLTIEPYLNMATGDAITLRWGDVRMDLPKIQAKAVGQRGAGLGAVDVDCRGRRRQPLGGDLLHSGPGRQQFALGAGPHAAHCRLRAGPPGRHALIYQPRPLGSPCEPG